MTQEIQDERCGLLHAHYVSPPQYIYIWKWRPSYEWTNRQCG